MRRCLCTVLMSCFLAFGTGGLMAGELTEKHAQDLYKAAQTDAAKTTAGATVTLKINGKDVVFTVTRDSLGSVSAKPVPGPDSAGITISWVKFKIITASNGLLKPDSLQVVSTGGSTANYSITYDQNTGTITGVSDGTGGGGGGGAGGEKKLAGGIGGGGSNNGDDDEMPKDKFPGFTSGQFNGSPGTGPGQVKRPVSPATP